MPAKVFPSPSGLLSHHDQSFLILSSKICKMENCDKTELTKNDPDKVATSGGSWLSTYFKSWKGLGYNNREDPNQEVLARIEDLKSCLAKVYLDRDKAVFALEKLQQQLKAQGDWEKEVIQLREKVRPLEVQVADLELRMAKEMEQNKLLVRSLHDNEAKVKELQLKLKEMSIKSYKECSDLKSENDAKLKEVEKKLKADFDDCVCEERKICSEEVAKSKLLLKKKSDEFSGIRKMYERRLLELEEQNSDLANSNRELDKKIQLEKKRHDNIGAALMDKKVNEVMMGSRSEMMRLKAENQELNNKISRLLEEKNPFPWQKGSQAPSPTPVAIRHGGESTSKNPEMVPPAPKRKKVTFALDIPTHSSADHKEGHQQSKGAIPSFESIIGRPSNRVAVVNPVNQMLQTPSTSQRKSDVRKPTPNAKKRPLFKEPQNPVEI